VVGGELRTPRMGRPWPTGGGGLLRQKQQTKSLVKLTVWNSLLTGIFGLNKLADKKIMHVICIRDLTQFNSRLL